MNRRWSSIAVVALALAAGGVLTASAAGGSPGASSFVPITPCRLVDTRPVPDNVGPRVTPIAAGETFTATVWGANGNCAIPTGATAVSMNVTVIAPTAASFLTVFPADATRPLAASLNWVAGQGPTPNAVTSPLSADGKVSFYNLAGTVDIAADIVGYYAPALPAGQGPAGPAGVAGPTGTTGAPAIDPARIVWVGGPNADFTSVKAALASITDASSTKRYLISIGPGVFVEPGGIDLKDWVDIAGSGEGATTISAPSSDFTDADFSLSSTLRASGSMHAEVRDLTVTNTGGATSARGVIVSSTTPAGALVFSHVTVEARGAALNYAVSVFQAAPVFRHVTASTSGAGQEGRAFWISSASPVLSDVTVSSTGATASSNTALLNQGTSSPTITDMTAIVGNSSGGNAAVANEGSSTPTFIGLTTTPGPGVGGQSSAGMVNRGTARATIEHSTVIGGAAGIFNQESATAKVLSSQVAGNPFTVFGSGFTCANVVNGAGSALSGTCG